MQRSCPTGMISEGSLARPRSLMRQKQLAASAQQLADMVSRADPCQICCLDSTSSISDHLSMNRECRAAGQIKQVGCGLHRSRDLDSMWHSRLQVGKAILSARLQIQRTIQYLGVSLVLMRAPAIPASTHWTGISCMYRGPNGVWTMQRAGKPLPKPRCSFTTATPSLTHMVCILSINQHGPGH